MTINEDVLRGFFAERCRFYAARARVPSPQRRFTRYTHHRIWHVRPFDQDVPFDDERWIEVAW